MKDLKNSSKAAKISQLLIAMFLVTGASAGITGCEEKGPAEKMGESIDEGVEEFADEVDDNT